MSYPSGAINAALMSIPRRAETVDRHTLAETFVDVGPLSSLLASIDHQILFGRRGTGKTHALFHLAQQRELQGDLVVYVDLRAIGDAGLYSDPNLPLGERGAKLLIDTLEALHEALVDWVIGNEPAAEDVLLSALDRLADSIASVEVVGQTEREHATTDSSEDSRSAGLGLGGGGFSLGAGLSRKDLRATDFRIRQSGVERHRVVFGPLGRHLQRFVDRLDGPRIWVLLDEWSSIPVELQPLLADLLRRSLFPVRGVTVKIAAIERRSVFRLVREAGDYLGIELGSDASAGFSLDDYMSFGNEAGHAQTFLRELLYRHTLRELPADASSDRHSDGANRFIQQAFKRNAFTEFVRASEGIPRDAINVAAGAAQHANRATIGTTHVMKAAKDWYLRDKIAALAGHRGAQELLRQIVDEVVGQRGTRTFLLDTLEDATNPIFQDLYDARVIHLLKRGVAWADDPGCLYDGYALDYGCYVTLLLQGSAFDPYKGGEKSRLTRDFAIPPDVFRREVISLRELTEVNPPG